jgi:hypothetical protein
VYAKEVLAPICNRSLFVEQEVVAGDAMGNVDILAYGSRAVQGPFPQPGAGSLSVGQVAGQRLGDWLAGAGFVVAEGRARIDFEAIHLAVETQF